MKKILNSPECYVDESLNGLCLAHPEYYIQPEPRLITRTNIGEKIKVGIVTGGGSGHLPIFTGYIGKGLLDAAAVGDVFASPSSELMGAAIKQADQGKGVLLLYGNYGGDVMNFDMACEMLQIENDIICNSVLASDDIASAPITEKHKRRGVAGMIYGFKIAGAMAEAGASLEEVTRVAQKIMDNTLTIGCALSPCILPASGKAGFSIEDDQMEMGIGIHGEPGIRRDSIKTADEIAHEMFDYINEEMQLKNGDEVSVLINSLGATPLEELYIIFSKVNELVKKIGAIIVKPLVGRYATSMEMVGVSLTLCKLDSETRKLLEEPAECAFLKV